MPWQEENAAAQEGTVAEENVLKEIDDDPLLREAGRIVSDLIDLLRQPPSAAPMTAKAPTCLGQPKKAPPAG